jgi:uncharacterized RDD family membrane protein YckC
MMADIVNVESVAEDGRSDDGIEERVHAGFWWRLLAAEIDFFVFLFFFALALGLGGSVVSASWSKGRESVLGLSIAIVVSLVYYPFLESRSWRTTPGKWILGLEIHDLAGNRASFVRLLCRHVLRVALALPFMVGLAFAAFTRRKQSAHDWLTRTLVTRRTGRAISRKLHSALPGKVRGKLYVFSSMLAAVAAITVFMLISNGLARLAAPAFEAGSAAGTVEASLKAAETLKPVVAASGGGGSRLPMVVTGSLLTQISVPGAYEFKYESKPDRLIIVYSSNRFLRGGKLILTPIAGDKSAVWRCAGVGIHEALLPVSCGGTRATYNRNGPQK